MDRNDILRLIAKKEKEFERNKLKRFALTVLFYTGIFFAIEYIKAGGIQDIADTLFGCLLGGIGIVLLSAIVFRQLFDMSEREKSYLEELNNELAFVDYNAKQNKNQ